MIIPFCGRSSNDYDLASDAVVTPPDWFITEAEATLG
jgi:hypothetical protein